MSTQNPIYDPLTPKNANQSVAEWQEPFLVNFQQMYDIFAKNHVPFDGTASAGTIRS